MHFWGLLGTREIPPQHGGDRAGNQKAVGLSLGSVRHPAVLRATPRPAGFAGPALGEDAAHPADCLLDGSKVSRERKPRPRSWLSEMSG